MSVVLGQKYKEKVHGRVGVAMSRTEFLTGCNRVLLEHMDKDGEVKDFVVDETLLVAVDVQPEPAPPLDPRSVRFRGGPGEVAAKPEPVRR